MVLGEPLVDPSTVALLRPALTATMVAIVTLLMLTLKTSAVTIERALLKEHDSLRQCLADLLPSRYISRCVRKCIAHNGQKHTTSTEITHATDGVCAIDGVCCCQPTHHHLNTKSVEACLKRPRLCSCV